MRHPNGALKKYLKAVLFVTGSGQVCIDWLGSVVDGWGLTCEGSSLELGFRLRDGCLGMMGRRDGVLVFGLLVGDWNGGINDRRCVAWWSGSGGKVDR